MERRGLAGNHSHPFNVTGNTSSVQKPVRSPKWFQTKPNQTNRFGIIVNESNWFVWKKTELF